MTNSMSSDMSNGTLNEMGSGKSKDSSSGISTIEWQFECHIGCQMARLMGYLRVECRQTRGLMEILRQPRSLSVFSECDECCE